jgi:hypothetical protein
VLLGSDAGSARVLGLFSRTSVDTMNGAVELTTDDTRGLVIGTVVDCDRVPVADARITASGPGGSFPDAQVFYFAATEPALPVRHEAAYGTAGGGRFALVLALPGEHRVVAPGRTGAAAARSIAEGVLPVFAGGVTVGPIGPGTP